jgi:tripartite-type tricarboxylate transporter receptor subunit TctC
VSLSGRGPAHAAFPERGVTVIVPYSAGGGSDISARLLARDFEPILGKPVTVENRVGGGGWVGWGSLAQSKPGPRQKPRPRPSQSHWRTTLPGRA